MIRYLKKVKFEIAVSGILSLIEALCISYYPHLLSNIIDNFASLKRKDLLMIFSSFILSVLLILLVIYLEKLVRAKYEKKICFMLRKDVFNGVIRMDYMCFHQKKEETYSSFLINDVDQIYALYFENILFLMSEILMLITYSVILALLNWQMCIIIMGSLILFLLIPRLVGKKYAQYNQVLSGVKADYLSRCEELLSAHDLIDSRNEERLLAIYNQALDNMQGKQYALKRYRSFVQTFSASTLYFQLLLCFIAGLLFSYLGVITLGVFASCLLYVEYVAQYSSNIVNEFLEIRSSRSYRDRLQELLGDYYSRVECICSEIETLSLEKLSYAVNGKTLLKNVSFQFEKGKKYLITGANGTGKSTLLQIMAGLIKPSGGRVLLNGREICNYCDMGYIPQRRYLFEGSLLDNITLFSETVSSKDMERVRTLCAMVNLDYSPTHYITRGGTNLSGGEIAKICLIREMFMDRSLLLIDEPLNDIDENSERDILDFLLGLEKTVVIVAHGLRTSEQFNCILTIKDSEIVTINSSDSSFM